MSTDQTVQPGPVDENEEDFVWLNLEDLHDDPENVRGEYTDLQELADSINEVGLLQPIVARRDSEGKHIIIMGHRRKRALKLAGKTRTRAVVRHREMLDDEVLASMLAENMGRVDLDPIDEARGIQKLKVMKGINDVEVAKIVGHSQVWVTDRLNLLNLDGEDQKRIRRGTMGIRAGVLRGRQNAGNLRPGAQGKTVGNHLGAIHRLAGKVQRRCESFNHKQGPNSVGGIGCGECWEIVIRTDERKIQQEKAITEGHCPTCGKDVEIEKTEDSNE